MLSWLGSSGFQLYQQCSTKYKLFTVYRETSMAKISAPLRTLKVKRFMSACISDLIAIRTPPTNFLNLFGLFGSEGCEAWVLSFLKILKLLSLIIS